MDLTNSFDVHTSHATAVGEPNHRLRAHQVTTLNTKDAVDYHYGKFPPNNLNFGRLMRGLLDAQAALTRYDELLANMKNSEFLLAPLRRQEAVVSSRMEGTISTLDEVLAIEAENSDGDEEAFKRARSEAVETFLYSRAMLNAQRHLENGVPLSEWLVRATHQTLLSYGRGAKMSPGSYKNEQNYIGETFRKNVSFIPISPERLPEGMTAWASYINDENVPAVLRTAISHVEFEALHPFKDENGRLGRMLITLLLWQSKVIRKPHFFVSQIFEERKDEYIERMRRVSSHGEWNEWCEFFFDGLCEQANRNIDTARQVFSLYEEMKDRIREETNSQWSISALDFLFANPVFRNTRFTKGAGIPGHVARRMTRILRDSGVIIEQSPASGRRPALYSFEPLLTIVRG